MFRRSTLFTTMVTALALAALGFGLAAAQSGGAATATTGGPDGEIAVQRQANLSGAQQIAEAQTIATRGEQISRRVSTMLDDARREQDIIRVTCLNDKLTQINANNRTVGQRIESLQAAVDSSDPDRRNHEYTVLTVLGQKFSVLDQEANQCISQDIFETGATQVTTEIDPATPDEDPSNMPQTPDLPTPTIPPPYSPTI